jgi:hypothetical protein
MSGRHPPLVHFQDQPQVAAGGIEADDEDAEGSSHHLVHFQEDAASTIQAAASSKPNQVPPRSHSTKKHSSRPSEQHQQQGQQQQQQHWNHKLFKRPPTPGAGLGQPVSIFTDGGSRPASASKVTSSSSSSSSSSNKGSNVRPASASGCYAGNAASRGSCSSASSSAAAGYEGDDDDESCGHVHFKEPRPRVTFKQALLHFSDSPTPPASSKQPIQHLAKQQQQQRAQSGKQQNKAQEKGKQQWVQKLSQRPYTPGGALGKPISIFSSSGSKQTDAEEAAAAVRRESASSSCDEQQEPAVKFADHDAEHVHAGTAVAAAPAAALAAARQSCNKKQADQMPEPAEVEHSGSQQRWHHKLSKRPPTPGVSLGKPISIFSSSGGSPQEQHQLSVANTPGPVTPAAAIGHQQQESAETGIAKAEDNGDGGHSVSSGWGVALDKNWASTLSKRPPTPGVGEGSLVSC